MKTRIKELQVFFRDKILDGEFEVISVKTSAFVLIEIMGEYKFEFYANHSFEQAQNFSINFMDLGTFSAAESKAYLDQFRGIIEASKRDEKWGEKLAEFEKLKRELEDNGKL